MNLRSGVLSIISLGRGSYAHKPGAIRRPCDALTTCRAPTPTGRRVLRDWAVARNRNVAKALTGGTAERRAPNNDPKDYSAWRHGFAGRPWTKASLPPSTPLSSRHAGAADFPLSPERGALLSPARCPKPVPNEPRERRPASNAR